MKKEITVRKSLRVIPMAIINIVTLIVVVGLFILFKWYILSGVALLFIGFFTLRSLFSEAVVTLTEDKIFFYSGLFSLGTVQAFNPQYLNSIYVKKTESVSYGNQAGSVNVCLIFKSGKKFEVLSNRITSDELLEFRNRIVDAVIKFYPPEAIPNWNEYQHDYFYDVIHS